MAVGSACIQRVRRDCDTSQTRRVAFWNISNLITKPQKRIIEWVTCCCLCLPLATFRLSSDSLRCASYDAYQLESTSQSLIRSPVVSIPSSHNSFLCYNGVGLNWSKSVELSMFRSLAWDSIGKIHWSKRNRHIGGTRPRISLRSVSSCQRISENKICRLQNIHLHL